MPVFLVRMVPSLPPFTNPLCNRGDMGKLSSLPLLSTSQHCHGSTSLILCWLLVSAMVKYIYTVQYSIRLLNRVQLPPPTSNHSLFPRLTCCFHSTLYLLEGFTPHPRLPPLLSCALVGHRVTGHPTSSPLCHPKSAHMCSLCMCICP